MAIEILDNPVLISESCVKTKYIFPAIVDTHPGGMIGVVIHSITGSLTQLRIGDNEIISLPKICIIL